MNETVWIYCRMPFDLALSNPLAIIGLAATVIFGLLAIKRKKYPGKITYVHFFSINLLSSATNELTEIKILHKDALINKNVILLKGVLINNGDIDISRKSLEIERNVTMELPEGCRLLDIKLTKCSSNLNAKISITGEKKAYFKFNLFRKNEFIQFEALIEATSNDVNSNVVDANLKFSHRIEKTSKIKRENAVFGRQLRTRILDLIMPTFYLILFMSPLLFGNKYGTVHFREKCGDPIIFYSAKLSEDSVSLDAKNTKKKAIIISLDDFNEKFIATNDRLTLWQRSKFMFALYTIMPILCLLLIIPAISTLRLSRKLNKILKDKLE